MDWLATYLDDSNYLKRHITPLIIGAAAKRGLLFDLFVM